jgi:hypothetical protein
MNVAVKESGVGIKKIANSLVCNGHDAVSFALANDAGKIAQYMTNKSTDNNQELVAKL